MSYKTTPSSPTYHQPHATISAQELAQTQPDRCGFLRKRGRAERVLENLHLSRHINWRQKFVVLKEGCCYCFDNEMSKAPQKTFSLEGYNRVVRRPADHAHHVFAVEPAENLRNKLYFFSAINEEEMRLWMQAFRKNMIKANDAASPSGGSEHSSDDDGFSELEKPILVKDNDSPGMFGMHARNCDDDDDDDDDDEEEASDDSDYDQPKEEWLQENPKQQRRSVPLPPLPTEANNTHNRTGNTLPTRLPLLPPQAEPRPPAQWGGRSQPPKLSNLREDRTSPPTTVAKPNPPAKPQKACPMRRRLSEQDCLFDNSDREAAIKILNEKHNLGTFLIRKSRQGDTKVLAVTTEEGIKEYKIFTEGSQVTLDKKMFFPVVDDLLEHYSKSNLPNRTMTLGRSYSTTSYP